LQSQSCAFTWFIARATDNKAQAIASVVVSRVALAGISCSSARGVNRLDKFA
jgi:hypothetical protein